MSPSFRKTMLVLGIWIISTLACKVFTPEYEAKIIKEATQTAAAMKAAQETPDAKDVTPASVQTLPEKAPPENPDEQFVFSFAGENQSYHTGLRNKTVFYIDYETGSVVASEEASFEESTGTQTRRGTDSVKFNGLYNANTKSFSGKLTLFTQGTATGSNYDNTVTYTMDGTLSAEFVDGQWVGTVTGTSTLKQVWLDGVNPDEVTTRGIEWTLIGIPVQ